MIVKTVEDLNELVKLVQAAQKKYAEFSQEQVDIIFRHAAQAANENRIKLAKLAVEETGMGIFEDKVIKNHFASEFIYNKYINEKTCGVIEEDEDAGIIKIAEPIGIIAGVVCYGAISLKNRLRRDDALDVWGVHGVGGTIGILLLGLFANASVNAAGTDGLFRGNAVFFLKETTSVICVSLYAFLFSYAALFLINKITPVKVPETGEASGLDISLHGEEAYTAE